MATFQEGHRPTIEELAPKFLLTISVA